MRILVVAPTYPHPEANAGDRQCFEIVRLLAQEHYVTFMPLRDSAESAADRLRGAGADVITAGQHTLDSLLGRRPFDVIIFEFWHSAYWSIPIVRAVQPWARIIVDTVDVHFARMEAAVEAGIETPPQAAEQKQKELQTYSWADCLITVTEEDRNHITRGGIETPCVVVPLLYRARRRSVKKRGPNVLFVGGFVHQPNVDGLLWFTSQAWPTVRASVANAVLTVVGGDAPPAIAALDGSDGIQVVGRVPDTTPYLDAAAVSIAPLRYGAGMKGKVIEAMAAGVPVVTTAFGVQGTGCVHGEEALVGDTAGDLACHVISVLTKPDLYEPMALRAQQRIEQLCGEESVSKRLDKVLDTVGPPHGPRGYAFAARRAARAARSRLRGLLQASRSAVSRREGLP
jgi:glycosyltransferase involved in cell wall biosynthesis